MVGLRGRQIDAVIDRVVEFRRKALRKDDQSEVIDDGQLAVQMPDRILSLG